LQIHCYDHPATFRKKEQAMNVLKSLVLSGFVIALGAGGTIFFSGSQPPASKEPAPRVTSSPIPALALTSAALGSDDKPAPVTGNFKGVVTLKGKPPARKTLVKKGDQTIKDAAVCSAADVLSDDFIVNEKADNGVANVIVYLKKAPEGYKTAPVPQEPVVFDQEGCRFIPHVLAVRCNQTILFKSADAVAHNINITAIRNTGFNQVIQPNNREGVEFKFAKPETAPVTVKCDLHPWMKAHHLPLEHPFFAVTDEEGKFEIKGLPPGKHAFSVWNETAGFVKGLNSKLEIVIKADETTQQTLSFTVADFKAGN
jgi:plastocyanin